MPHMRLSQGALLAGAVNVPLLSLVASVTAWLFTSAAMVQVGGGGCLGVRSGQVKAGRSSWGTKSLCQGSCRLTTALPT